MPFTWKNIRYISQKLRVEKYIKESFGTDADLIKEVMYDEDRDDKTPCILVIFWSSRALSFVAQLEIARYNIEKDRESGLERFRIDIMAAFKENSRRCLLRRATRFEEGHSQSQGEMGAEASGT